MGKQYWSEYWSQGNVTSFSGAHKDGYQGVFKSTWESFFRASLFNHCRLLDLATGSGALLHIAANVANTGQLSEVNLTGVDYSRCDNIQNDSFEILFNTDIQALPFEGKTFDLVTSNFGLEYADIALTFAEVTRVLRAEGKFHFVCHSQDSDIVLSNRKTYACGEEVLSSGNACDNLKAMFHQLDIKAKSGTMDEITAAKARDLANEQLAKAHQTYGDALFDTGIIDALNNLLRDKSSTDREQQFGAFMEDLKISQQRLQLLFNAALSNDKLDQLIVTAQSLGLSMITSVLLDEKQRKVGVVLSGRRVL